MADRYSRFLSLLAISVAIMLPKGGHAMQKDDPIPSCAAQDRNTKPINRYVSASAAAMRMEPAATSRLHIYLPIATPIAVSCQQDGWLRAWSPTYKGAVGWVRADLVEVIEPTLGSALHDLATAHPATLRRQAERVLALGVLDEQAHEVAITALVNAGEHVLADQAKRRLAALRSPEVVVRPDEPRVIFVADGELMSPMAKLTDGKLEEYPRLSDADESRMEQAMQNFADRYFVPVRAYYHYGRGGGRGIALVRRKEEPSCSSLTASFKLVSAQASPAGIVTNFPLADGERVPERAPTPAEMRTALELVRSVLVQAHVPAADRTRLLRDARKPGGALTLAAVPLRDSAFPLLVVTSNLEIPPESDRLSAPPYRAYALVLIAQADEHGRYRIDHHELARPGSEQEFNPRRFVTYMDLDQDGSDELVFAGTGYEWWWYEALGRKQGRWSQLVRGGGGGC